MNFLEPFHLLSHLTTLSIGDGEGEEGASRQAGKQDKVSLPVSHFETPEGGIQLSSLAECGG